MKNHELAPVPLIGSVAKMHRSAINKTLSELLKNKLIHHENVAYDGYRLTYAGYDILALRTLSRRDVLIGFGRQIGIGKESDIYMGQGADGKAVCIKFQRLGRTSFRSIKNNRDYHQGRKHVSWHYLSRLAALKEFAYLKALHANGFPVPTPIDNSRHCVVMELKDAVPMYHVREVSDPAALYSELMGIIVKMAEHGLIHGDFNEFNILIDKDETITMIDLPQIVSTDHANAEMYFDRDVTCIRTFFAKQFKYESDDYPIFSRDIDRIGPALDVEIAATGFTRDMATDFDVATAKKEKKKQKQKAKDDGEDNGAEEEEDEEEEDEESEDESGEESEEEESEEEESEDESEDDAAPSHNTYIEQLPRGVQSLVMEKDRDLIGKEEFLEMQRMADAVGYRERRQSRVNRADPNNLTKIRAKKENPADPAVIARRVKRGMTKGQGRQKHKVNVMKNKDKRERKQDIKAHDY